MYFCHRVSSTQFFCFYLLMSSLSLVSPFSATQSTADLFPHSVIYAIAKATTETYFCISPYHHMADRVFPLEIFWLRNNFPLKSLQKQMRIVGHNKGSLWSRRLSREKVNFRGISFFLQSLFPVFSRNQTQLQWHRFDFRAELDRLGNYTGCEWNHHLISQGPFPLQKRLRWFLFACGLTAPVILLGLFQLPMDAGGSAPRSS